MLRDADGTVHMVPNSQMTIISNLTRDWTQLTMHVAVDYKENSDSRRFVAEGSFCQSPQ